MVTRLRLTLLLASLAALFLLLAPTGALADSPAAGVPICSPVANLLNGAGNGLGLGGGGGGVGVGGLLSDSDSGGDSGVGGLLGDDDKGTIGFSAPSYAANEAAGQFWITITRTNTARVEIIRYGVRQDTALAPSDFQVVPNTEAVLVPGQASCQFPVTITDNGMNGPSIQADAYLFGSTNATIEPGTDNAFVTILRNDPLAVRNPTNPLGLSTAPTDGDPLTGASLYVQTPSTSAPGVAAQDDLSHGDVADATALNFIAAQPFAYRFWFWNTPADPAGNVARYLEDAQDAEPGRVVELSTYSVVHDACGSTETAAVTQRYLNWIRGLAQGIGNFRVVMFFEVDSLITAPCLTPAQRHIRFVDQLRPAIKILEQSDPHLVLYLDAGASDAVPAPTIARWLREAGVNYAQGFFVNSTHFQWDTKEIAFGQQISRRLGGHVHFVVSSGLNGRGPLLSKHPVTQGVEDLCNPPGRGLGTMSVQTGYTNVDGMLWFGAVGNSSGPCVPGAPPTAQYWPAYAVMLYKNRNFAVTGPKLKLQRDGTFVPYSTL